MRHLSPSCSTRSGLSLLEMTIAAAVLAGVVTVAANGLSAGLQLRTTVASATTEGENLNRILQSIAQDLRNAKVNEIWLAGNRSAWASTTGQVTSYSFRTSTGFNSSLNVNTASSYTSYDSMIKYDRGVILTFDPVPGDSTRGRLCRTDWELNPTTGELVKQLGGTMVLTDRLVWKDGNGNPGFVILDVVDEASGGVPEDTTLVVDGLETGVVADTQYRRANQRLKLMGTGTVSIGGLATSAKAKPIYTTAQTTISLRQTRFDQEGVMAPVITSNLTVNGSVGNAFQYGIQASNYPTAYGCGTLPAGLVFNAKTGYITGTPTQTGTSLASITAENAKGYDTKSLTIQISGSIPVISAPATMAIATGGSLSYAIVASYSPTSYNAYSTGFTTLPAGLSINKTSGVLSGSPSTGTYQLTLAATNANGTGTRTLQLDVGTVAMTAPVITSLKTAVATIGQTFAYVITATEYPKTYGATGLPIGLTIDTGSGLISGTPAANFSGTVVISATNDLGTTTANLLLTVQAAIPVLTAVSKTAMVNSQFSHTISGTNSPTSFAIANKPDWMTVNQNTGLITGTPTTSGTFTYTMQASNATGTGSASLALQVSAVAPPVISSVTTKSGNVNSSLSYTITASGTPTTYGASGLPSGLSVNSSTGVISGTPTTVGTTVATISASNAGGTGSADLQLVIGASLSAPTINLVQVKTTKTTGNKTTTTNTVTGTIVANNNTQVNYSSFGWSTTNGTFSLNKGWNNNVSTSLTSYQFTLTSTNLSGSATVTCWVTNANNEKTTVTISF